MRKLINTIAHWVFMTLSILAGLFSAFMLGMQIYVIITGTDVLCLPMVILCLAFVIWGLFALDAVINPEKYN